MSRLRAAINILGALFVAFVATTCVVAALACATGTLQSDPLPARRPAAPYLCAVNHGGSGQIIVRTNMGGARLMTVDIGTTCRSLPYLQEVYLGFEPTSGLRRQRIYWTPIPLRPQSEPVECWFVDVSVPTIAIGAVRPCIERP